MVLCADQPFGLTWLTKMKMLGVVFGHNAESDNWRPKLKKLENHLNFWKSRSFTLTLIAVRRALERKQSTIVSLIAPA